MELRDASARYLTRQQDSTCPLGYKQTEVGLIPEDWNEISLGTLLSFKNGLNKSKKFFGYGTPIVNYMDVYRHSGLLASDVLGRVDVTRQELDAFGVRRGDVFFTRTSETVEEVGIASVLLEELPDTVFSGFVLRARPKNDALSDRFKKYCFSSCTVRNQIIAKSTYTTRALTNGRALSTVVLPLPPTKAEQEAIAEALSDADALIESLEQLLAKKRYLKQGAMQELLSGTKRLPGFSGEWEVKRLDELGRWTGGMTPSMRNSNYWESGTVPWISSGDVKAVRLFTTAFAVSEHAVKQRATTLLPANSIIVVTRSGILRKYLPVAMNMVPMAINQDIKALLPNENVLPDYLMHSLISNGDRILARCLKSGTTVESIEFPWLKAFTIPIPQFPEQTAIATILTDMDAEIAALEEKLAKVRVIKQGMMQELLTGRIRLL